MHHSAGRVPPRRMSAQTPLGAHLQVRASFCRVTRELSPSRPTPNPNTKPGTPQGRSAPAPDRSRSHPGRTPPPRTARYYPSSPYRPVTGQHPGAPITFHADIKKARLSLARQVCNRGNRTPMLSQIGGSRSIVHPTYAARSSCGCTPIRAASHSHSPPSLSPRAGPASRDTAATEPASSS